VGSLRNTRTKWEIHFQSFCHTLLLFAQQNCKIDLFIYSPSLYLLFFYFIYIISTKLMLNQPVQNQTEQ